MRLCRAIQHYASFQVFVTSGGIRLVWIADVLPKETMSSTHALVEQGAVAIKQALPHQVSCRRFG